MAQLMKIFPADLMSKLSRAASDAKILRIAWSSVTTVMIMSDNSVTRASFEQTSPPISLASACAVSLARLLTKEFMDALRNPNVPRRKLVGPTGSAPPETAVHMDRLKEIDTSDVEPMAQILIDGDTAAFRADIPAPPLGNQTGLANAPQAGNGYFKVPRVIER